MDQIELSLTSAPSIALVMICDDATDEERESERESGTISGSSRWSLERLRMSTIEWKSIRSLGYFCQHRSIIRYLRPREQCKSASSQVNIGNIVAQKHRQETWQRNNADNVVLSTLNNEKPYEINAIPNIHFFRAVLRVCESMPSVDCFDGFVGG